MPRKNAHQQPIGDPMPEHWSPPSVPPRQTIEGRYVRVEPLDPRRHTRDLWDANQLDQTGEGWTYMFYGPFQDIEEFQSWIEDANAGDELIYFAFVDVSTDQAIGWAAYMRINLRDGVLEVGDIRMSPRLQRTTMATEAMHLMMKQAFELGYRRYEWKCDALNAPSRRAAERLGFTYEGTFRKATHYKGRSRDTAWFSVVDHEWPIIAKAQTAWLDPTNFDADGHQIQSLSELLRAART